MIQQKIDSRICVKQTEEGFKIERQDITVPDAKEVLQRILLHIRMGAFMVPTVDPRAVVDSATVFEQDPDTHKVCIAFNDETKKCQYSVTGMNLWTACVLLDSAIGYFDQILFTGAE